ncbi:H-NS histone family protein [Paraburkholderia sp. LEh10]|uniref:H-NS family nucleoid-associated regulatory protein n=1 Tax=Paraburkholderia sp. LEh10 TaxID=2821353 RepID=UPI001AE1740E|nr:H-NS family nucleoid-associated regulatory protein [Paraburkholderia sp. LEh10]MBP0590674.1 H-NS histone family protein [Paraburkholderia sp. LEh10]
MKRSYDAIQAEIQKLQREAAAVRSEERDAAIGRIRAEMARYDISADELRDPMPAVRGGTRAKNRGAASVAIVTPAATGARDESPAVRLLEEAGIDFRRKIPLKAPKRTSTTRTTRKGAPKAARTAS